ncbi:MAG: type II toxin-antitoxin system YafQ family toxin [Fibrobacter sp.]|uniref:type II toxin-antitoxin system YafQ family toxin n=1 Tax=Fibrobacter sp. TaxID=35828 RepID=UPI001B194750|nr:type II toxin-antitoxin system YafQ family toxin [Fibrobacter sp.]MBO7060663.1 type II toxin-antitoxin system YafQ family toxin [Fibrobacter sp.]MBO7104037.1 type II toxin-antitoxin system YafQ family toxin [Fibrobacter sp.]
MPYQIEYTTRFKKEYKLAKKRGRDINLLRAVIEILAKGEQLPEKYKDHPLVSNWVGYRECHIQSDWLLIYKYKNEELILSLTATGTHSDLF